MKQKYLVLSALLAAVLLLFALSAGAEKSGDYEYALNDDGTVTITKYTGKAAELEIPSELDGKKVTRIGEVAFFGCYSLTSLTIPDSVTIIGSEAFNGCHGLISISIPSSVTSIGNSAFERCSNLTSIKIPDSVTSIGDNPFIYCTKLQSVKVSPDHSTLAVIDRVLFNKLDKSLIWYPKANEAFDYSIPQGIVAIGKDAFCGCGNLTSVTIPDSVTSIGEGAFEYCENLTSVTISDSVTSIGNRAFDHCKSLTSVMIPDSVTSIGYWAFGDCSSLISIMIPDSVTYIGEGAFSDCLSLTLTVPRGSYAAQYCNENDLLYIYPDSQDWLNN